VVLKAVKKQKRPKWDRKKLQPNQEKKHSSGYFTVAVKSSGDISAEPVRGQKIEEHVVTDLDLRNDENRPSSTSSAIGEERQDVSLKNSLDEMADVIIGGYRSLGPLDSQYTGKKREYWSKYETGSF